MEHNKNNHLEKKSSDNQHHQQLYEHQRKENINKQNDHQPSALVPQEPSNPENENDKMQFENTYLNQRSTVGHFGENLSFEAIDVKSKKEEKEDNFDEDDFEDEDLDEEDYEEEDVSDEDDFGEDDMEDEDFELGDSENDTLGNP